MVVESKPDEPSPSRVFGEILELGGTKTKLELTQKRESERGEGIQLASPRPMDLSRNLGRVTCLSSRVPQTRHKLQAETRGKREGEGEKRREKRENGGEERGEGEPRVAA